ncbi:hypothetical protein O6H91_23G069500 [Diphasiastrum complanatum]|uniref:Uncharacterized protein n=1 Tax=Diphasiastrum complanatum TaxID=34168 RepID=A0ACC2AC73_DIPCM|nr:hypothetical protein O6H91_23G069500 [Diphasiastrum complanatum]
MCSSSSAPSAAPPFIVAVKDSISAALSSTGPETVTSAGAPSLTGPTDTFFEASSNAVESVANSILAIRSSSNAPIDDFCTPRRAFTQESSYLRKERGQMQATIQAMSI